MSVQVPTMIIGSIDVTKNIETYVKATQSLRAAKTAEEISKWQNVRTNAALGVADALLTIAPIDRQAAQAASVALGSVQYARNVMTLKTVTLGTLVGIIFGAVSLIFSIVSLVCGKREKSVTISAGWVGEIVLKLNKVNSKIEIRYEIRPGQVILLEKLTEQIKVFLDQVIGEANTILAESVPARDVDFVWRYLPRPENDTIVIKLQAVGSRSVTSSGEANAFVQEIVRSINKQLGDILRVTRDIVEGACILVFLKEIGAEDKINYAVESMIPGLAYQVEGLWRKELERLTIKLARSREYDRQISAAIRAAVLELIAEAIANTPPGRYNGSTLSTNREYIRNKLYELGKQNVEIRYGIDLIGHGEGTFKYEFQQVTWSPENNRRAIGNRPPGWLWQDSKYIIQVQVKDNKLQLVPIKEEHQFKVPIYTATIIQEYVGPWG